MVSIVSMLYIVFTSILMRMLRKAHGQYKVTKVNSFMSTALAWYECKSKLFRALGPLRLLISILNVTLNLSETYFLKGARSLKNFRKYDYNLDSYNFYLARFLANFIIFLLIFSSNHYIYKKKFLHL